MPLPSRAACGAALVLGSAPVPTGWCAGRNFTGRMPLIRTRRETTEGGSDPSRWPWPRAGSPRVSEGAALSCERRKVPGTPLCSMCDRTVLIHYCFGDGRKGQSGFSWVFASAAWARKGALRFQAAPDLFCQKRAPTQTCLRQNDTHSAFKLISSLRKRTYITFSFNSI